ncbi:MAG TPA: serine hydroxymethyltransferase [Anaerolineae bacterium]|nr:serine hydroxymethyltransferase [Anaerolineae bacterium]
MLYPQFQIPLEEFDPDVHELIQLEAERQRRRIILIPSESAAPLAVREALGSTFQNLYAEGYPNEYTRWLSESEILDYKTRLAFYRRYSVPRYYKGVEYADIAEVLARRRCAQTFAANGFSADDIYVNVQALSGSPANNAVFHALLEPGDTVLSMDLLHGGHLSHGSPANRSGKYFNIVHYSIDPQTKQINYETLRALALEHKPKMIIGGYSSYPWAVDWGEFRSIADLVGAYLLADIAHVAGLVAGGAYPSPIGYAHVTTSTTHKSLYGPRGAIIMTTDPELSLLIDQAVFPGEQGGPHVNVFAALCLTFKFAQTKEFRALQHQIVSNCVALAGELETRGFRIAYGGTNTHLMNLDCKSVVGPDGTPLSGDQAARILDLVGIVVNRNTLPGDETAYEASGIRMGTPWITQLGFGEKETAMLADIIADTLQATIPCCWQGMEQEELRGKVDFEVLENSKLRVIDLCEQVGIEPEPNLSGYPHFYTINDASTSNGNRTAFDIGGDRVRPFLNYALTSDIEALTPGESQATRLITPRGAVDGTLTCESSTMYRISVPAEETAISGTWLRALSDGYVRIDDDIRRKCIGPVWIQESNTAAEPVVDGNPIGQWKPFYIGIGKGSGEALPGFTWEESDVVKPKRTALNETHREIGAKMVTFVGWDMPVWYTSVYDEHVAVREAAGLFDVAHMGVFQVEGPDAAVFLDSVCANDICGNDARRLRVGSSLYTQFLDPDANVIDDLLIYRRGEEKFLLVVNAANDEKDWAWLNAVREGRVCVDHNRPWALTFGRGCTLRNMRDPKQGDEMLVDLALQGPQSRNILLALGCDEKTAARLRDLPWAGLMEGVFGGFDLIVSCTGYTGERVAYELFIHPEKSVALWQTLLEMGEPFGLKPAGLGARDSLRTEAGLPLHGQEMAGELGLGVGDAGFAGYVKTYKPWFIGRSAFMDQESARKSEVARFRFNDKGVRMAHYGDPVVDRRGRVIGVVTSCAVDLDGYLLGQAHLKREFTTEGTPIAIFQGASKKAGIAPAELSIGDQVAIPTPATVLSRFPPRD